MRKSLASLCLLVGLLACRSDKPEDRIRGAFERCRAAVEAGDAAVATEPLAEDFRGPEGMDRPSARLFLMGVLRQERVGVTLLREDLRVQGAQAVQDVDLVLTGRRGSLLPQEASTRSFRLLWRRQGGDWKLKTLEPLDGR